jgi:hypothetical protein
MGARLRESTSVVHSQTTNVKLSGRLNPMGLSSKRLGMISLLLRRVSRETGGQ